MSGILADGVVALDLIGFSDFSPATAYRVVQWPQKVTVTGVCFTINQEAAGDEEDGREWTCYAVKGRKAVSNNPEDVIGYTDEDIVPFFGENEKPIIVTTTSRYASTVGEPVATASWYTTFQPYTGNVAQMDPDEYLTIWIEGTYGNFGDLTAEDTYGVITISYTGAASTA